jgi:hypothetical protein
VIKARIHVDFGFVQVIVKTIVEIAGKYSSGLRVPRHLGQLGLLNSAGTVLVQSEI